MGGAKTLFSAYKATIEIVPNNNILYKVCLEGVSGILFFLKRFPKENALRK